MTTVEGQENKRQRVGDQRLPHTGSIDVGPEVIADVVRYAGFYPQATIDALADDFRARIGYPLQTTNGRDAARNALEDAAHHLKQLYLETRSPKINMAYLSVLGVAFDLVTWIANEKRDKHDSKD